MGRAPSLERAVLVLRTRRAALNRVLIVCGGGAFKFELGGVTYMNCLPRSACVCATLLVGCGSVQALDSVDARWRQVVEIRQPVANVYAAESANVILRKGAKVSHFLARDATEVVVEGGAEVTFMQFRGRLLTIRDGRFREIAVLGGAEAQIHRIEVSGHRACPSTAVGGGLAFTPDARVHLHADVLAFNNGVIEGVWEDGSAFSLGLIQQESPDRQICKRPATMPAQVTVHDLPGPSFDCSRANARAEKLVCADAELSKLDMKLARSYQQARAATQDPDALVRAQRRWLAQRNKCADIACLKAVYEQRSRAIAESGMTNDRAKTLCQTVVESINDGSIRQRFVAFERDAKLEQPDSRKLRFGGLSISGVVRTRYKGREHTFVALYGGGTCASCSIVDLEAKDRSLEPPDDDQERLRWAAWGGCDELLWVDGEAILVTGRFGDEYIRGTLVSWIDPKGTVRPLCYLGSTGEAETRIAKSENEGLCRAVLDGRAEEPKWHYMSIPKESPSFGRFGVREGQVAALDLDLDGAIDYVGRMSYEHGGGCGGHFEWFDHVAGATSEQPGQQEAAETETAEEQANAALWREYTGEDQTEDALSGEYVFLDSALGRWLRDLPGGGLLEHVPGTPVKMDLLTYDGKPYVLTGGSGSTAQVVSFWGGVPKTWCEYRILPRHAVEVFYPIETWPKAADN
jgi:uncharacterized protein